MASFIIVRIATPSKTPPHSQESPEISMYATLKLSLVSQEFASLSPDPFSIPAEQAVDTHSIPSIHSCCIIPLVHEQIKVFRVCNSFLSSAALTEKPRILHSKGLELFSFTWHLHCAGELGTAFEAGVLLLVKWNGEKKKKITLYLQAH